MVRQCLNCGVEFVSNNPRQVFCKKSCRNGSQQKKVTLICQSCGKQFERRPYDLVNRTGKRPANDGKYCSRPCATAGTIGVEREPYKPVETRTCLACGKSFIVGGRRGKPRKQRFCSNECRSRAVYHSGARARDLTIEVACYLAGFIDGEGSIMLYWREGGVFVKLQITNSDKNILHWITDVTGVGGVSPHKHEGKTNAATWSWVCSSEAAETILLQIRPYMRIKATQADLAIETQERLRNPALKADRTWQAEYRERMKSLNQRGPRTDINGRPRVLDGNPSSAAVSA